MPKSRETMLKRAREKARQAKQEAKREKRRSKSSDDASVPLVDEDALMEEFARLSARFEAGHMAEEVYRAERHRIFVELGIETER